MRHPPQFAMKFYNKVLVLIFASLATASSKNDTSTYQDFVDRLNSTGLIDSFGGTTEALVNATQDLFVDSTKSESNATYREEFLDPNYWHPKSRNFEIINWTKFEEKCGDTVPFTYDPVQRNGPILQEEDIFSIGAAQWGRLDQLPDEVIATGAKPSVGTVTDPEMGLFYGILGQAHNSSLVPEPLRNKLIWMYDNFVPEYLLSFNRVAWRENTPEGRVVGLHNAGLDYTNPANEALFVYSSHLAKFFNNIQVSPSGKFMKMYQIPLDPSDPTVDGGWLDMYVVQEGDVLKDRNGNVIDYVKPGDVYRLTTKTKLDPYDCFDELRYAYLFRTVAVWDEDTKTISPGPAYDALVEAVTAQPTAEERFSSKNFTNSSGWTTDEKFDFLVTYEPDRMMYKTSPMPPSPELLNEIGSGTEKPAFSESIEGADYLDEHDESQDPKDDEDIDWSSSSMHVASKIVHVLYSVLFIMLF